MYNFPLHTVGWFFRHGHINIFIWCIFCKYLRTITPNVHILNVWKNEKSVNSVKQSPTVRYFVNNTRFKYPACDGYMSGRSKPLATNCVWRIYQPKWTEREEKKNQTIDNNNNDVDQKKIHIRMILDDFSFLINSYSTFVWFNCLRRTTTTHSHTNTRNFYTRTPFV